MLMSAGVIPMLVQILGNQQCIQTKVYLLYIWYEEEMTYIYGIVCVQDCQSFGCYRQCIFDIILGILQCRWS